MFALPMGRTKSSDISSSVISNSFPYEISSSRNTTGLLSRIAAFSKPLASRELYGANVKIPGQELNHAAKHCECWAPTAAAAPFGPRKTMGHPSCPPDMYRALAAEL